MSDLHHELHALAMTEGNDQIRCSRMHFREWASKVAEKDREIERLRLLESQAIQSRIKSGKFARLAEAKLSRKLMEAKQEIERLRERLLVCSSLASGQMHAFPSDRCAAICEVVKNAFAARAAGGGG